MIIESNNKDIKREVLSASMRMIRKGEVWGYVLLRIPILITDEYDKPYDIFTNGKMIVFNTNRVNELKKLMKSISTEDLLKHQLSHILLNHVRRQLSVKKKKLGIPSIFYYLASEYVVNKDLEMHGQNVIDKKWLISNIGITEDEIEHINKLSFEQLAGYLYMKCKENNLIREQKLCMGDCDMEDSISPIDEQNNGFANIRSHLIDDVQNDDVNKSINNEISENGLASYSDLLNDIVRKALVKTHGMARTGLWTELEGMLFSHNVNWRKVLVDYVKTYKSQQDADEGLKYVNRRYFTLNGYNPKQPIIFNKKKQIYDKTLIAIDTSGSISDEDYKRQIGEVLTFLKQEKVRGEIVLFTSEIEKGIPFTDMTNEVDLWKSLKSRTSGGTSFVNVFDYAFKSRSKLLIIFSDLYAEYPERTYWGFNVLLMTYIRDYNKTAEKYGRVIYMKSKT